MCGLFGVAVTTPRADRRHAMALRMLAFFNKNRGTHSYGLWSADGTILKKAESIQSEGGSANLAAMAKRLRNKRDWVMGHTRQATAGGICDANAHPFTLNGVTLAHNGVVCVEGYDEKNHPVDSGRILHAVGDHGWVDGMAKVSGSCGLIVTADKGVYLYRHNQSLHFSVAPWGILISSDLDHIKHVQYMMGEDNWEHYYPEEEAFYDLFRADYTMKAPCSKGYKAPKNSNSGYKGYKGYKGYDEDSTSPHEYGGGWPGSSVGQYKLKAAETAIVKGIAKKLHATTSLADFVTEFKQLSQYQRTLLGDLYHDLLLDDACPAREWTSDLSGVPLTLECTRSGMPSFSGTLMWDADEKCMWLVDSSEPTKLRSMYGSKASDLEYFCSGAYPSYTLLHVLEILVNNGLVHAPASSIPEVSDDPIVGPIGKDNEGASILQDPDDAGDATNVIGLDIQTYHRVKDTQPFDPITRAVLSVGAHINPTPLALPFND